MKKPNEEAMVMAVIDEMSRGRGRPRGKTAASSELIESCREILATIQPASVRAVCYQLFVRKLIPDMGKNSTGKVSKLLVYAREQGLVPWEWIVDDTRGAKRSAQWNDLTEYAECVSDQYRRDRWTDQPRLVEVWSEKGTVSGTLSPVLKKYGVSFRVMHGYSSATIINDVADLTADMAEDVPLLVFYCGDYDPSGMHMSEVDLPDRLYRYGANVSVIRVALTRGDCEALPGFSVIDKKLDSRYRWFAYHYGASCWELDALNPNLLRQAVESNIRDAIDFELWDHHAAIEKVEFESLKKFADGLRDAGARP